MTGPARLVRRAPTRPLVWLGEREPTVALRLGERFPAFRVKERDLVFEPTGPRAR